jgi:hypothetical protein
VRNAIIVLAAFFLVSLAALPVIAQEDNSGPNCSELESNAELQAAIDQYGEDTYDDDNDGIACDSTLEYNYRTGDQDAQTQGTGDSDVQTQDERDEQASKTDAEMGEIGAPDSIDTGGGYCAVNDCK